MDNGMFLLWIYEIWISDVAFVSKTATKVFSFENKTIPVCAFRLIYLLLIYKDRDYLLPMVGSFQSGKILHH